jgi:hypothetical protein
VLGVIPCLILGITLLAYVARSFIVASLTEGTRREIHRRIDTMISDNSLGLEGMLAAIKAVVIRTSL